MDHESFVGVTHADRSFEGHVGECFDEGGLLGHWAGVIEYVEAKAE